MREIGGKCSCGHIADDHWICFSDYGHDGHNCDKCNCDEYRDIELIKKHEEKMEDLIKIYPKTYQEIIYTQKQKLISRFVEDLKLNHPMIGFKYTRLELINKYEEMLNEKYIY